jgi:hypothetical protein
MPPLATSDGDGAGMGASEARGGVLLVMQRRPQLQ